MGSLFKSRVLVGSAPEADVRLHEAGVAPHHAAIERIGDEVLFVDLGVGQSWVDDRLLNPGERVTFDPTHVFRVGRADLPLGHPVLFHPFLQLGNGRLAGGHVTIGRDPQRTGLVILHPAVSAVHASFDAVQSTLTDLHSTSGTYASGARLEPLTPHPVERNDVVFLGPVPVHASVLRAVHAAAASRSSPDISLGDADLIEETGAAHAAKVAAAATGPRRAPPPPPPSRSALVPASGGRAANEQQFLRWKKLQHEDAKLVACISAKRARVRHARLASARSRAAVAGGFGGRQLVAVRVR